MSIFFLTIIIALSSSLVETVVLMYHLTLITNTKRAVCKSMLGELKLELKGFFALCSMVVQVAEVGKDAIGLRVSPLQFR